MIPQRITRRIKAAEEEICISNVYFTWIDHRILYYYIKLSALSRSVICVQVIFEDKPVGSKVSWVYLTWKPRRPRPVIVISLSGVRPGRGGGHAWSNLHTGLSPALSVGPLSRFSKTSCWFTPVDEEEENDPHLRFTLKWNIDCCMFKHNTTFNKYCKVKVWVQVLVT